MLWGPNCVKKFNGMFAFAIWDNKEQSLHLARDRYGIKPMYYAQYGNTFIFASELKAILEHPKVDRKIDKKLLLNILHFKIFLLIAH